MRSGETPDLEQSGVRKLRVQRGAEVVGTDGSLGTVELVVIDRATGELQSLVLRGEAGMDIQLPSDLVESATGDHVYLSIGKADLAAHPEIATPHNPDAYVSVDEGAVMPPSEALRTHGDVPVLTRMEADAVEFSAPVQTNGDAQLDTMRSNASLPDHADQPTIPITTNNQTDAPTAAPEPASPVRSHAVPQSAASPAILSAIPEAAPLEDQDTAMWRETAEVSTTTAEKPHTTPADTTAGAGRADLAAAPTIRIVPVRSPASPPTAEAAAPLPRADLPPLGDDTGTRSVSQPLRRARGVGGMTVSVAVGGLLLGAAATTGYIVMRRRERPARLVRQRIDDARATASDLRAGAESAATRLRARANSQLPALRSQMRDGSAQARDQLVAVSKSARDWRNRGLTRLSGLGPALALFSESVRDRYRGLVPALKERAGDARTAATSHQQVVDAAIAAASDVKQRAQGVSDQIADSAAGARHAVANAASTTAARAERKRQVARHRVRRVRRCVRWFQRGVLLGAVLGVLYAPEPGRDVRARIAGMISRVPGLRDVLDPSASPPKVGATGPRPGTIADEEVFPRSGDTTASPLLRPMSEEPIEPSSSPDIADEVPGTTSHT
jgi:hypothetical protein